MNGIRKLLELASDERSHTRLIAAQRRKSGARLNVLPVSAVRLQMDDDTIWVAMVLRMHGGSLVPATPLPALWNQGGQPGHSWTQLS